MFAFPPLPQITSFVEGGSRALLEMLELGTAAATATDGVGFVWDNDNDSTLPAPVEIVDEVGEIGWKSTCLLDFTLSGCCCTLAKVLADT